MEYHHEEVLYQEELLRIQEERELILIKQTGAKLSRDGNQYCYLIGEDMQSGVAGFGKTPYAAMMELNRKFYNEEN
jgi:hypothetical protein